MSTSTIAAAPPRSGRWHLWVVAVTALLWNGAGAYTMMTAQARRLELNPDEAA